MAKYNTELVAQVKCAKKYKKDNWFFFTRFGINRWMSASDFIWLLKVVSFCLLVFYIYEVSTGVNYVLGVFISAVAFLYLMTRKIAYKNLCSKGEKRGYFATLDKYLAGIGIDYYDNSSLNEIIKLLKKGKVSSIQQAAKVINKRRNPPNDIDKTVKGAVKFLAFLDAYDKWEKKRRIKREKKEAEIERIQRTYFPVNTVPYEVRMEQQKAANERQWQANQQEAARQKERAYQQYEAKKQADYLDYQARKAEAYNRNSYDAKVKRNRADYAAAQAKRY